MSLYAPGADATEAEDLQLSEPEVVLALYDALAPYLAQAQAAFPSLTPTSPR